ncbi:hypothetical protein FJR45_03005 [Sulfurimonas sediminis]|uniref:Uncharacterized protein n=1 Tax=Sulfurimonas sediminis TaxID=2590020 RepID=A0A7M1AZU3_9BACT|nr:hypothetical protein [Sulfurimonas sediminis]QOP42974.1 hypothetical protein FJR45_03005 [Sulfurimonas sediminis]
MERKITIEGNISVVSLSNVGTFEEFNLENEEINEESEIKNIMEEIDAYAQSGELDAVTDVCTYKVMNDEDIEYLACADEESEEKEISMERFQLVNQTLKPIKNLLTKACKGDIIYLRKEQGKANIILSLEMNNSDEAMSFSYFDCSTDLDEYDLLRESYYDVVCDTFLPESLATQENKATVENFVFEPQIIYGELYKVIENEEGLKSLQKIEFPGYYFQDAQRDIDE